MEILRCEIANVIHRGCYINIRFLLYRKFSRRVTVYFNLIISAVNVQTNVTRATSRQNLCDMIISSR